MKRLVNIVSALALLSHLTVAEEEKAQIKFDMHDPTAQDVLSIYAFWTRSEVLFRDRKEMRRIVSVASDDPLAPAEAFKLIETELGYEGLKIVKLADNQYEIVKHLSDEEVAALNKKAGRQWRGPRYAKMERLGRNPKPPVRFEPKMEKANKTQQGKPR